MDRKKLLYFRFIIGFLMFIFLFLPVFNTAAKTVDLKSPITLDIKGMDILDVLKIISMRSGLSIAPSPMVKGKISIFLKNVSVWDAFEIIVASNSLAYEKKGDLLTVVTGREYEEKYGKPFYDMRIIKTFHFGHAKAASVYETVSEFKSKIGKIVADDFSNTLIILDTPDVVYEIESVIKKMDSPLETKVIQLNYAKVEDIEEKVQDLITQDVGSIKFDETSNRIVVTDIPNKVSYIEKVIKAFDKRPKEVLIEAKIIQITLDKEHQYGVDWEAVLGKEFGLGYAGDITFSDTATGIGKIAIGKIALGGSTVSKHEYRGLFKLFDNFGTTEVLASPRITALSGQEAYVLLGEQQPLVSISTSYPGDSSTPQYTESVEYLDLGVRLSVTPTISDTGDITMKIKPEVSSQIGDAIETVTGSRYIVKGTSETETTVMIKDGATIVLAGLMKEETIKNKEKIPGLSDIPLIGKMFKGEYSSNYKTELVILLTPRIVTGEGVFHGKKNAKIESGKKEQLEIAEPYQKKQELFLDKNTASLDQEEERQSYSEYYLKVTNNIYGYLSKNYLDMGLNKEVNVVFLLNKRGNLVGEPAVVGEVDPSIRDLAIEVVKKAGPYPVFPSSLDKEKEAFNILLSF
ncbi:MAG: secretin N-terminal domain-containing protein [Candidatus Saelkia tenebricola]|nr:secretin N-terminal domain-containing protein [Candidatus Saelkia tenebricola]